MSKTQETKGFGSLLPLVIFMTGVGLVRLWIDGGIKEFIYKAPFALLFVILFVRSPIFRWCDRMSKKTYNNTQKYLGRGEKK